MVVAGLVSALLMAMIWLFILRGLSRESLDPLALFCYLFALLYGARALILSVGLDGPYPDYLFGEDELGSLTLRLNLMLVAFLSTFVVGYVVTRPVSGAFSGLMPFARSSPRVLRQARLVAFLTLAGIIITFILVTQFGGFEEMVRAAKVEKELEGLFVLRIAPAIGAIVSTAFLLDLLRGKAKGAILRPVLLPMALIAASLNSLFVFLWGSRSVAIVAMFVFLAGRGLFHAHPIRKVSSVARLAMLFAVIFAGILFLRQSRDVAISGEVTSSLAQQSLVRQLSVASNAAHYDAALLVVRDWPARFGFRDGEDFANGVLGIVPRRFYPQKPEIVTPGRWFRQIYEPAAANGWPSGAAGDWYLNFGFLGVLLGGGLSGALLAVVTTAYRRVPRSPWNFAIMAALAVGVFPLGVSAETSFRWVLWALPFLLASRYVAPIAAAARSAPARQRRTLEVESSV